MLIFFYPTFLLAHDPDAVYFPKIKDRPVIGWREEVAIKGTDLIIRASSDPALEVSSLLVDDYRLIDSEGEPKIEITLSDLYGNKGKVTSPIVRKMKLKKSSGKVTSRYIVMLKMCLAGVSIVEEVGIIKNKKVGEQLRLGRTTLAGRVCIDPSREFVSKPECKDY